MTTNRLDQYFLRLWLRPKNNSSISIQVVLEIPKTLTCFINYTNTSFGCLFPMAEGNNLVVHDLSGIIGGSLSFNAWLHIAIAGNASINQTYLRIDLPD